MSKWWLISDETAKQVITYLEKQNEIETKHILHEFETGLNTTNVIPDDWRNDKK